MKYILALVAFAALPAHAQQAPMCSDPARAAAYLMTKYGESRIGVGVRAGGDLMEIFANPESGTWTVLMTRPGGLACMVASGEAWQTYEPLPQGTPG